MSERADPSTLGDANLQASGNEGNTPAGRAGQMLRQAREAHGLHVDAMAFSLKVPVAKLQALEAGRIDLLPDLVFARGLAASVCRNLKVDPAPVLELLPRTASARVGVEAPSINAPFRPPGAGPNFSVRGRLFSPAVIAVVALLVGALLLLVWPKMHEVADSAASGEPPPPVLVDPTAAPLAAPADAAASSAVAAAAPSSAAVPAAVQAVPAASAPGAPGSGAIFLLSAKAESWVKVTDAKGLVSLNRIIKPGETVQADGTPPMAVVIGRADAVQVQVRGQPLDLVPVTKVNVARFEVK